jgi:hypothetical protein
LRAANACSGEVIELPQKGSETLARCTVHAVKANGDKILVGKALVAV